MTTLTTFGGNADFVRALGAAGVQFLVVGGLAVVFHDCRNDSDADDLDLLLDPSPVNAQAFIGVLDQKAFQPLPSVAQLTKPNLQIPMKWRPNYYLDILTPQEGVVFEDLLSRSGSASLNGVRVRVISRPDLIAMKRVAVERLSVEKKKHKDDLCCLETI